MAQRLPYTYYACPCTDISDSPANPTDVKAGRHANRKNGDIVGTPDATGSEARGEREGDADDEEQTLDPHSKRANYALYPLENLLFCNECHELRCPRCYYEEALYYYCPNCLFESGSSVVKNESNTCGRSCFQCPICIATLSINSLRTDRRGDADLPSNPLGNNGADGPYILSCPQCSWSSLESGLTFDKSTNISGQLGGKMHWNGNLQSDSRRELSSSMNALRLKETNVFESTLAGDASAPAPVSQHHDTGAEQFARLANFYKTQIAETSAASGGGPFGLMGQSFGLDSPSTLSRLLSTYGVSALKKQKGRVTQQQREALVQAEGLYIEPEQPPSSLLEGGSTLDWPPAKLSLTPIPIQLRAKRSKRCPNCRSPLSKPDEKRHSTRYKIRLLAASHIPLITLKPYDPHPLHSTLNVQALPAGKPAQFLLTVRNPLFDGIKISLATPRVTPGRLPHRVTILCPTFDVGANRDVWDEALDSDALAGGLGSKRLSRADSIANVLSQAVPATSSGSGSGSFSGPALGPAGEAAAGKGAGVGAAEAGKVWDKGRNWTTVILELVPSSSALAAPSAALSRTGQQAHIAGEDGEDEEEDEEVDVVKIPVHIRIEYEASDEVGDASGFSSPLASAAARRDRLQAARTASARSGAGLGIGLGLAGAGVGVGGADAQPDDDEEAKKTQRELSFWCCLFAGQVAPAFGPGAAASTTGTASAT